MLENLGNILFKNMKNEWILFSIHTVLEPTFATNLDKYHPKLLRFNIWPILPDRFDNRLVMMLVQVSNDGTRMGWDQEFVCLNKVFTDFQKLEAEKVISLCMHFKTFQHSFCKRYNDTEVDQRGSSQSRRAPAGAAVGLKGSSDPSLGQPRLVTLGESGVCVGV